MNRIDTQAASTLDFQGLSKLRAEARTHSPEAAKAVAQQFEGLMLQTMLKSLRETSFGDDLTGASGGMYRDMFDQQIAQQLASGKGMGLADMLVTQLRLSQGVQQADTGANSLTMPGRVRARIDGQINTDPAPQAPQSVSAEAQWQPGSAEEFVAAVRPHAEQAARELGVPAKALVAQAALETGWGQHLPRHADGSNSLNLFGIKAGQSWDGEVLEKSTQEFADGAMRTEKAAFRSYGSLAETFGDYVRFLQDNPRYADALREGAGGVDAFARGLQRAGYATDPHYAQKIVSVAESDTLAAVWHRSTPGSDAGLQQA